MMISNPVHVPKHAGRWQRSRRRGVVLLLATFAVFVSAVISYNYLAMQATSTGVVRSTRSLNQARCIADSCLDLTLAYIAADPNWRSKVVNGVWTADAPMGGGTCTVLGEDGRDANKDGIISIPSEGDGDFSAASGGDVQSFTLTITAQYADTRDILRGVITQANTSLVGAWKLDETSGNTVTDSSGRGQNGTVYNASPPEWQAARVNNGLHFDNSTNYVAIPDNTALDAGQSGTLSMWFKMDMFTQFAGLIHKGVKTNFSDEAYTLQFWDTNKLYFGLNGDSSSGTLTSSTAIATNTWYHVVATWDPSGMKLYLNGQLNCSNTKAVTAMNSAGDLILGAQLPVAYNSNWQNLAFNGTMDETQIYNRALTAAEIGNMYNLINPGNGSGGGLYVDRID